MIKVAVVGALGKMGKEVIKAVLSDDALKLVMAIDVFKKGEDIGSIVVGQEAGVKISTDIISSINTAKPDVVVDFTQPSTIYGNIKLYMENNVKSVIGTTGLSENQLKELRELSKKSSVGCLIAPNFSTGAILMMKFAKEAAKYFDMQR
jgi:4-hydroxy-tetrahydrodipicolinate reductase